MRRVYGGMDDRSSCGVLTGQAKPLALQLTEPTQASFSPSRYHFQKKSCLPCTGSFHAFGSVAQGKTPFTLDDLRLSMIQAQRMACVPCLLQRVRHQFLSLLETRSLSPFIDTFTHIERLKRPNF